MAWGLSVWGPTVTERKKFPFGRMAVIRLGLLSIAQGVVMVVTAGEVSPRWVIDDALKTALRAQRRARAEAGG